MQHIYATTGIEYWVRLWIHKHLPLVILNGKKGKATRHNPIKLVRWVFTHSKVTTRLSKSPRTLPNGMWFQPIARPSTSRGVGTPQSGFSFCDLAKPYYFYFSVILWEFIFAETTIFNTYTRHFKCKICIHLNKPSMILGICRWMDSFWS